MRVFTTLLITVLAGCASKPAGPPPRADLPAAIAKNQVDAGLLHNQLILFADESAGEIAGTMSNIAAASRDRVVWEQTLLFKTRVIPLFYLAARGDDPRAAVLDMWVLLVRIRHYLTTGDGRTRFGTGQAQACDAAARMEQRFLVLVERFYPREAVELESLKDEVEAIAARNPLSGSAGATPVNAAAAAAPAERGALGAILAIPLAPVSGVGGISKAAGSIDTATRAFESFTQVTQLMPEQIRWQAELLLLEADSLDSLVKVRQDLDQLSDSMESIARTAATLPGDVRSELEKALPILERLDATIGKAHALVEAGNQTARDMTEAGDAWQKAAVSVNDVLHSYEKLAGPPDAVPPDPNVPQEPTGLALLATSAEKTQAAADALRALLTELESDRLTAVLARTGSTADALVDRITWRAILVVAAFAASMVVYRLIVSRFAGSRAAGPNRAR